MNGKPLKLALTLSPILRKGNPLQIFRLDCIDTLCALIKCCSDVVIYPEFAENGRLHYHGVLYVNDLVKWYKSVLPTLNHKGFVLIKSKNIDAKWSEYCSKNWEITKNVLNMTDPVGLEYLQKTLENHKMVKALLKDKVRSLDEKARELTVVERLNNLT